MKLNRLFIAGLLSVSMLASCNKENNEPNTDFDGQGYMTLQVLGNAAARTEGENHGNATAEESAINKLDVYLCEDDGKVVKKTTLILSDNDFNTTQSGARTKPFTVPVGVYRVWVVANSDNNVGVNIKEHKIDWSKYPSDYASHVANPNNFTMVNQINGSDDDAPVITITADNDFSHPATCDVINLDRLTAKVEVSENTANTDFIKGVKDNLSAITNMELQGYKMINTANKIWGIQHWAKAKSSKTADGVIDNRLDLSGLNTTANPYSLQNKLSSARDVEIQANSDPRVYTVVKDDYDNIGYYDAATPKGVSYVPEYSPITISASNLDEATTNNTTGVLYQYKATVTGSDEIAGANCFYCYDGNYFATLAELAKRYTNFVASDLESELRAAYAATDRQTAISNFRAKHNIKVYTDGIVYYTYYIKDENYSLDGTAKNKLYSIMRNTWYGLTVNSLKRIGEDIPGGWEPDRKIDTNEVFMVVEVKVNPWVLSNTDIDLQ